MKKIIALMLALVMVMGLVACGGNGTETQPQSGSNETKPAEPVTIKVAAIETDMTLYAGWEKLN